VCDGINIKALQAYVCSNPENYEFDVFENSYNKIGYINVDANMKYIKKIGYDANNPSIQLPIEIEGSSETYTTDFYHSQSTADLIVLVGGYFSKAGGSQKNSGLWNWHCRTQSSKSNDTFGCRLLLNE